MTILWTADALCTATGGEMLRRFDVSGVSIDTRTLRAGDLFVALMGENSDGHVHITDALARGAAGAMVHKAEAGAPVLLRVGDTLQGLQALGMAGRARFRGRAVAVTGSVGKTTTKEMLRALLGAQGKTHAAEASYNNHWGVPLTLARMPADAAYLISEIGMNHPGEILPLSRMVRPHVALIVSVEAAHLGHMGSLEAIADEKASIAGGLEPDGVAVMPGDHPLLPRMRQGRVLTFGAGSGNDAVLLGCDGNADGSVVRARVLGKDIAFRLGAPGRHMAMNAVAALLSMAALGADVDAAPLAEFQPVAGRGLRRSIRGGQVVLLDESYNASSASVRAALALLKMIPAQRRVAVLGDMRELGEHGPDEHVGLAAAVMESADILYSCGELTRYLHDALPATMRGAHVGDAETLGPLVARDLRAGDAVLVKGSYGSRMRLVVQTLEEDQE